MPGLLAGMTLLALMGGVQAAGARNPARVASEPTKTFHSVPNLHPPVVSVSSDPDTRSGDIFLTIDHTAQRGPMILNSKGQLVWFLPVTGKASNFAVQSYRGKRVLTWWQGPHLNGKDGADVIMNRSYQIVATVHAAGTGYSADLHDFQITPEGTAFINAVVPVKANLVKVGGPSKGYVFDNVIQEIDIATGKQLWSWHSFGHIPVSASYKRANGHYCDCYHLNSIQPLSNGNLLVSSRSTWSVYEIDVKTHHILWTLGGKYNQFKLGPGVKFEWQHDVRLHGNVLTLFDDAAAPQEEPQSSAKKLRLNVSKRKVRLIHRYTHSPPLLSPAQGSTQLLPNGNVFVGWGTEPFFSEYTRSGKQILRGSFSLGETSYRAYRFRWSGQPTTPPALAVTAGSSGSDLWASWNGATDVASWQVLGGPSCSTPSTLTTRVAKVSRYSFETEIKLSDPPPCVEVQALNGQGTVLGTSSPHSAS